MSLGSATQNASVNCLASPLIYGIWDEWILFNVPKITRNLLRTKFNGWGAANDSLKTRCLDGIARFVCLSICLSACLFACLVTGGIKPAWESIAICLERSACSSWVFTWRVALHYCFLSLLRWRHLLLGQGSRRSAGEGLRRGGVWASEDPIWVQQPPSSEPEQQSRCDHVADCASTVSPVCAGTGLLTNQWVNLPQSVLHDILPMDLPVI